MVVTVVQFKI